MYCYHPKGSGILNSDKQSNHKQGGLHRDRRILRAIEEYSCLDTEQVQALFFKDMQYGRRKAQERLLKLHRAGKLNRGRSGESPYYYYIDKKPGMTKHLLATNWVRIWLPTTLPSWEKIHSWNYEQDYKVLRCDGFAAIKNTMTNKFRFMFIEMDRGTNAFDKVQKYNRLYKTDKYSNWWWVSLTERFPVIRVVTVHPDRKSLIQSEIEAQNHAGLEFNVKLLDDIRKEVMAKCYSVMNTTGQIE